MLVSDGLSSANDLEPRTKRVFEETMTFILLAKGGRFEVEAASGNRYEAEIIAKFCTCPDWQQRTPDGGVNICIASITIKETNDNRYYWQWWEGHKMTFKYNSVNPDE
ncbi:hypothetical protein [Haloarcula sebkhae]|nr:hypothetical protein [Haloarcula sebkhae]